MYSRVECFFVIRQKTAFNQRPGMILEVQIQIFGAQSFHFQKIPGGLNISIFLCENQHKASFYIKGAVSRDFQTLFFFIN